MNSCCGVICRTTVEEGGETVFPSAETKVKGSEWSECAQQGLAVKTRKGDALLFFRFATAAPRVVSRLLDLQTVVRCLYT